MRFGHVFLALALLTVFIPRSGFRDHLVGHTDGATYQEQNATNSFPNTTGLSRLEERIATESKISSSTKWNWICIRYTANEQWFSSYSTPSNNGANSTSNEANYILQACTANYSSFCSSISQKKPKRTRRQMAPIQYYPNSVATFHLLTISGDVSPNSGPVPAAHSSAGKNSEKTRRYAPAVCPKCEKTVRVNHKRSICEVCISLTHALCCWMSNINVKQIRADTPRTWTCDQCLLSALPFHKMRNTNTDEDFDDLNLINVNEECSHHSALTANPSHLSLMHLNTQSMTSTFDELQLLLNDYPFDEVTLNRQQCKGGGVGAHIRENVQFKRRADIEHQLPDFEHMWLEFPGRNKNSKLLVGTFYRSKRIIDVHDWLDHFQDLLSDVFSIYGDSQRI